MAESYFLTALSHVHEINQSIIADKWEPLLNNLGHTCRKLKKYDDALRYHQQVTLVLLKLFFRKSYVTLNIKHILYIY